jgi:hypothetical protein
MVVIDVHHVGGSEVSFGQPARHFDRLEVSIHAPLDLSAPALVSAPFFICCTSCCSFSACASNASILASIVLNWFSSAVAVRSPLASS